MTATAEDADRRRPRATRPSSPGARGRAGQGSPGRQAAAPRAGRGRADEPAGAARQDARVKAAQFVTPRRSARPHLDRVVTMAGAAAAGHRAEAGLHAGEHHRRPRRVAARSQRGRGGLRVLHVLRSHARPGLGRAGDPRRRLPRRPLSTTAPTSARWSEPAATSRSPSATPSGSETTSPARSPAATGALASSSTTPSPTPEADPPATPTSASSAGTTTRRRPPTTELATGLAPDEQHGKQPHQKT